MNHSQRWNHSTVERINEFLPKDTGLDRRREKTYLRWTEKELLVMLGLYVVSAPLWIQVSLLITVTTIRPLYVGLRTLRRTIQTMQKGTMYNQENQTSLLKSWKEYSLHFLPQLSSPAKKAEKKNCTRSWAGQPCKFKIIWSYNDQPEHSGFSYFVHTHRYTYICKMF